MNTLGSRNVKCVGLHHRVRHSGSSAFMDRYTILFRLGPHLLRATNYRLLRGHALTTWQEVTCAQ